MDLGFLCAATYAENEALKWALDHGEDPRVPEALHLVVQATYRGCRESESDPVGKRFHQARFVAAAAIRRISMGEENQILVQMIANLRLWQPHM